MSVFPNEWYHCVGIFDPDSSKTTLYLNGKSSATNVLEFDGNSDFVRLGRGYWNRTFDGLIDDVRVWGRALSGSEVEQVWEMQWATLDQMRSRLTLPYGVMRSRCF